MTIEEKYEILLKKYELLFRLLKGLLYCQEYDLKRKVRKAIFEIEAQNGP